MLENLYIKNFVLIDELNIDFNNDFAVFTGETGAGKSIFIDSISILLGGKLTTAMIKQGKNEALIEGCFSVDEKLKNILDENGYDCDSFIVTRQINVDGKSTTRLNQRITTVSFIKECLEEYVDIHCQHDNQYLLNEKNHLELLDSYFNNQKLKELNSLYSEYHKIENQYNELLNTTFNQSQIELINYQLNELNTLNITDTDEDQKIEEQLHEIAKIEKNQKNIEDIKELFTENGILEKLYNFSKLSNNFSDNEHIKSINDAYYTIEEEYNSFINDVKNQTIDGETVNQLNQRLFDLQKAKRKYNTSLIGLSELKTDLENQLENFGNREYILSKLEKNKNEALEKYRVLANEISYLRKEKALLLEKEIIEQLKDLSLSKAQFKVNFSLQPINRNGVDKVEFLISMNPGQPLQPLAKVASGGELSRLMLGLKVIFAKLHNTKLIIFDEIDTGVSGFVALNIGIKMAKLANNMQVFSVTHLPAVAACGKSHYLISKQQYEDKTTTNVNELDENQRIQQLAILSSSNLSENSINAAQELYNKAQELIRG